MAEAAPPGTSLHTSQSKITPPSRKTSTYLIRGTPDLLINFGHRKVQANDFIVHEKLNREVDEAVIPGNCKASQFQDQRALYSNGS